MMSIFLGSGSLTAPARPVGGIARLPFRIAAAIVGSMLLAASAKVKVVAGPVDMSLQTLAVFLIAAAFGLRLGLATVVLYLAEGAMGFPVFQGTPEKGLGLLYMAGPTGGFLAGFVAAAAIVGWASDRGWGRSPLKLLGALLAAEAAMMMLGFAWLATLVGPAHALQLGVLPFLAPDLVKVVLVAAIVPLGWALLPDRR